MLLIKLALFARGFDPDLAASHVVLEIKVVLHKVRLQYRFMQAARQITRQIFPFCKACKLAQTKSLTLFFVTVHI